MSESISFDRAASFYDATRKLRDDLAASINAALLAELRKANADRLLEVGIGTGRMARPLMAEGIHVTGVDISGAMMAQLLAQLGPEHTPPDLLLGDATRLPFCDDSFPAALVVHVFHLVASAENAIAEIRRVLAPGGVLIQQTRRADPETQAMWDEHEAFWDSVGAIHGFKRRHQSRGREIDDILTQSGATLRETDLDTVEDGTTVEDELDALRTKRNSWTWDIPDAALSDSVVRYEKWLRGKFPSGHFADRFTYTIQTARWP